MKKLSKPILLLAIIILSFPVFIEAKISPSVFNLLNQVYGNYDAKRKCWVTPIEGSSESYYCMKITKSNIINTKSGKRNYLVLTSDVINKSGEEISSHAASGKAGLFIIDLRGAKLLAAKPEIFLGSFGMVPKEWNLIKLAPSDYWGWQTSFSYVGMGLYFNYYIIFAPYGKMGIKELTTIVADYDDSGAGGSTEISAKIKVDNLQVNKRVFPLKVKITGKINGKKLRVRTWVLPFNTRKWQYVKPKRWPLANFDY
jgi:hypothetical protein